ncbi:MAG: hypothetical protein ACYCPT_02005 [Acidimicrobiales bacterium]
MSLHLHVCTACGHGWWHDAAKLETAQVHERAHTCGRCGKREYWISAWQGEDPRATHPACPACFVGWTQPPRPICVVPSVCPSQCWNCKIKDVLRDPMHDDDVRDALGHYNARNQVWDGGVRLWGQYDSKFDVDTEKLLDAYYLPPSCYYARHPDDANAYNGRAGPDPDYTTFQWYTALKDAIPKAIAKRCKLGPLPENDYSGDPITIYYYDNDRVKRITYPRASIVACKGYALDPHNIYWWKCHCIHTCERHCDGTWGCEGFAWDKDVAGNIMAILDGVIAAVGAILTATGIGAGAGAAFFAALAVVMAYANAVAAYAGVIDAAFQGGDMRAAGNAFVSALAKFLSVGDAQLPAGMTKKAVAKAAAFMPAISSLIQTQSGTPAESFQATAAEVVAQAKTMTEVDDEGISTIEVMLGARTAAAQAFSGGYRLGQYASPDQLAGIASLFVDDTGSMLFQLGAYLGIAKKEQARSGFAPPPLFAYRQTPETLRNVIVAAPHYSPPMRMRARTTLRLHVAHLPETTPTPETSALVDLSNYVHDVLFPRYHLS